MNLPSVLATAAAALLGFASSVAFAQASSAGPGNGQLQPVPPTQPGQGPAAPPSPPQQQAPMASAVTGPTALTAVQPTPGPSPIPSTPTPAPAGCNWGYVVVSGACMPSPTASAMAVIGCWDAWPNGWQGPMGLPQSQQSACNAMLTQQMNIPAGTAGAGAAAAAGAALAHCNNMVVANSGPYTGVVGGYRWHCSMEVEPTPGFYNFRYVTVQVKPLI